MGAPYAKLKGTMMIERVLRAELPARARRQGRPAGARRGRARRGCELAALARDPRSRWSKAVERATATRTWRRPSRRAVREPRAGHRRLPERLRAAGRRAVGARRRRDRRADQRARRAPATTTSSSPRATGTRPTTARSPSRAASGPCTASQGTDGRRSCTPTLDAAPLDVIVDKGQDPGTEGYSGFDGTALARAAARARRRRR